MSDTQNPNELTDRARKAEWEALIKELAEAGAAWAKLRARVRFFEDGEKPLLGAIIRERNDEGAAEIRKQFAYGDAQFRQHLKEKHEAQFASDFAWLRLERARAAVDEHAGRWSFIKMEIEKGIA